MALLSCSLIALIHRDTIASLVQQWLEQETYSHGFLVAPTSAWLIWRRRADLRAVDHRPDWPVGALVVLAGLAWTVGAVANANSPMQFSLIASFIAAIVMVVGRDAARKVAFALAFLLFAVPFGDFLVAPMMAHTADFTVWALQRTGIPVWREGLDFVVPTGKWSVVAACSGLRYVIASVTVGSLFAYLNYHSTPRRLAFVALSLVVPVIANWLRAYGIVMLGHLSDMKLAAGVDHLIYGWIFFGFVMIALFAIGSRWQDAPTPHEVRATSASSPSKSTGRADRSAQAAALAVALTLPWPMLAKSLGDVPPQLPALATIAHGLGARFATSPPSHWQPAFQGFRQARRFAVVPLDDQAPVEAFIAAYGDQGEGSEMIAHANAVVRPGTPGAQVLWRRDVDRPIGAASLDTLPVKEWRIRIGTADYLAWHWYAIGTHLTANDYLGKLWTAWSRLRRHGDGSMVAVLATRIGPGGEKAARKRLGMVGGPIAAQVAESH